MSPHLRRKESKGIIAWDVDRQIRVEVDELLVGDTSFGGEMNEPDKFLEDRLLCLESQLEFLELRGVELGT